jgi:hypothetical protein
MSTAQPRLRTARALLLRAAVLVIFFLAVHAAGWRSATTLLSGSTPAGGPPLLAVFEGVVYLVAWIGLTVMAPLLILAAALIWLSARR